MSPTLTWLSFATPDYAEDLAVLTRSAALLGPGHEFVFRIAPCSPFRHTIKFDLLREELSCVKTSHLFWIDADCEFLTPLDPSVFVEPEKPLTAVRHFSLGNPLNHLPEALCGKIVNRDRDLYWQSCLFGGTVAALGELLRDLEWMDREGVTYDEHGFVIEMNRREDVLSLPCRFATPSSFAAFPDLKSLYEERAAGLPVISHHNRNLNRKT